MNMRKRRFTLAVVIALLCGLVVIGSVLAGGGMVVGQHVIGGGGGMSSGGDYAVYTTIGQPVVGTSSRGDYELCAGYWCGASPGIRLYLPTMKKKS